MGDIQRYVPLKQVVAMAIDEEQHSPAEFDRYWVFAFRALVDIYFGISAEPKSVRLPVNGNLTVNLPADYVTWTKIGIMGQDGKVSTLKVNKTLSKFRDNNPNRLEALQPDVNNDLWNTALYVNYYYDGMYTPLFGGPQGLIQYGECVVDEQNKIIVLSPLYQFPDVVLEYLSSPEQDNDYRIEVFLQEAVIAFCKWKDKRGSADDYYNRLREGRRKLEPIRLQTVNEAIRANHGYKIKA